MTEYIRKWVKYSLFFTTILSWIAGAFMVAIGSIIIYDKSEYMTKLLDVVVDPAITFIFVGAVIFIISIIGTVGALRENMLFLNTFVNALMICVGIQLMMAICVLFFYTVPDARFNIRYLNPETYFKQYIKTYMTSDDVTNLVDAFQEQYKCCGYSNTEEGYKDWEINQYFTCQKNNTAAQKCGVPHSCCKPNLEYHDEDDTKIKINLQCGDKIREDDNTITIDKKIYRQGCMKAFHMWLEKNLAVAVSTLFCVIVPQVATMFLAMSLDEDIAKQMAQWTLKERTHRRKRGSAVSKRQRVKVVRSDPTDAFEQTDGTRYTNAQYEQAYVQAYAQAYQGPPPPPPQPAAGPVMYAPPGDWYPTGMY